MTNFQSQIRSLMIEAFLDREFSLESIAARYPTIADEELFLRSLKLQFNQLKNSKEHTLKSTIRGIVLSQFYKFDETSQSEQINASSDVLVIQTSDPVAYTPILNQSSLYNERWCRLQGVDYIKYVGIKKGNYAHHAILNRIYLLKELIRDNFKGWVFYIDADALVIKGDINIKEHCLNLSKNKKRAHFHSVQQNGVNLWDINDGVFMLDLGSDFAVNLVNSWFLVYETLYTNRHFEDADAWYSILTDQQSLHIILQNISKETLIKNCQFDQYLQGELCIQFLTGGDENKDTNLIPTNTNILTRAERIRNHAEKFCKW